MRRSWSLPITEVLHLESETPEASVHELSIEAERTRYARHVAAMLRKELGKALSVESSRR